MSGRGRAVSRATTPGLRALPGPGAGACLALAARAASQADIARARMPRPSLSPYLGVRWRGWLSPVVRSTTSTVTAMITVISTAPAT